MQNNIAEKIKDLVTIPQALTFYGFRESSTRRIPCPIHNGSKHNFCYTDKVYHCWTCGAKGDVITLVQALFGLSFSQALVKINSDFRLGIAFKKPTIRERKMMAEERRVDEAAKRLQRENKALYDSLCACHRAIYRQIALGDHRDDLIALQVDMELWLDDNIEEVRVPWII